MIYNFFTFAHLPPTLQFNTTSASLASSGKLFFMPPSLNTSFLLSDCALQSPSPQPFYSTTNHIKLPLVLQLCLKHVSAHFWPSLTILPPQRINIFDIILPSGKYFSFCPYDTMFHVNVFKLLARLKGPGGGKTTFYRCSGTALACSPSTSGAELNGEPISHAPVACFRGRLQRTRSHFHKDILSSSPHAQNQLKNCNHQHSIWKKYISNLPS